MIKIYPNLDSLEILDISDEEYFGEYSDYISNSRLSLINPDQGGSVERYLAREKTYSDSLLLGSAVHGTVLQPDDFNIVGGIHRPTAKLGLMADELYKSCVDPEFPSEEEIIAASDKIGYYKGKMNPTRIENVVKNVVPYVIARNELAETTKQSIYLDDNSYVKYQGCIKSIEDNKDIQSLLYPESFLFNDPIISNEATVIIHFDAVNTETGEVIDLPFKAKLDNFTIVDCCVVLNDLKTTGHLLQDFPESFEKYHYYRQMGVYSWLLSLVLKKNIQGPIDSFTANMLVVSTAPEYQSRVFKVKRSDIIRGFEEFKHLLKLVAQIYV